MDLEPALTILRSEFREALESYDVSRAEALFRQAMSLGLPMDMVEALVTPTLEEIGRAWEEGRLALSQIYLSAACANDW
ncbi:MAG: B12-binding domain-containing protein [Magnetococcales bacterium]|nr:B12-binding domain-containing protein [Magnetococcales bacterium]